jgi:hypothetical protein
VLAEAKNNVHRAEVRELAFSAWFFNSECGERSEPKNNMQLCHIMA